MKILFPSLKALSFPDCMVAGFSLDVGAGEAVVAMSGAWLDGALNNPIGPGRLAISGWSSLICRTFDHAAGTWVPSSAVEPLKDICEAEFGEELIVMRGFSAASGLWIELKFLGGSATFEVDENHNETREQSRHQHGGVSGRVEAGAEVQGKRG